MRMLALIAVVLSLSALAAPARAGMVEDCEQDRDLDRQLNGCTAVIRSGEYSGKELAVAYNNRGNAHDDLGNPARAIEDYDQALRIDPSYAHAYYNRGFVHDELGQYRRAILDYNQSLRYGPGDPGTYRNRGVSYENLGRYERAVEDWEQEIKFGGAERVIWWQKYLKDHGHYSGAVDGIHGPNTRRGLLACARDPNC